MKGIANRQNTLLGRKPVLFGGGRPSPGDRSVCRARHAYRPRLRTRPFPEVDAEPAPTSTNETPPDLVYAAANASKAADQGGSGVIHEKPDPEEAES